MNWHETIEHIRKDPALADLVDKAYFDADLSLNVERFISREEFADTLDLLKEFNVLGGYLLDVGSGNGISAVSFALKGFCVTALEPDPSETVGSKAILSLKQQYDLKNLSVVSGYAENLPFNSETFDVVYVRQAVHHAADLKKFISECYRVLKKGGLLLTVRDHVVFSEEDKEWFLQTHPLHKYYGGENAYSDKEYEEAFFLTGFSIIKKLRHFDSVINYYPMTSEDFVSMPKRVEKELLDEFRRRYGFLALIPFLRKIFLKRRNFDVSSYWDERKVAGRLYSYLLRK